MSKQTTCCVQKVQTAIDMTGMLIDTSKNRQRELPSFANINLLGACNVDCFFCLGKDIEAELKGQDQRATHFRSWANFDKFLDICRRDGIRKLYITGQNTDSLLYRYLRPLIEHLQCNGFQVGLRTNGYGAIHQMDVINLCDLSVGYSIHSLCPTTNRMIMCRKDLPPWREILTKTQRPRVQIVVNRCNAHEFFDVLRFVAQFPNVRYVQARRVSTDRRLRELYPDIAAYEQLYTTVSRIFPLKGRIHGDAEIYEIYGKDVCFWRTVKTSINSYNYFTDGTVSQEYFVVEGYLKNRQVLSDRTVKNTQWLDMHECGAALE